ncbi:MAG: DUF1684 domain-containing protein [Candidatus Heimdallarchaeota archaeon]|nr:DUF1684 domain-containing protein [Candidatus Heimdallarchaeota archaeon]MBY8993295.1 DUF1684 domain-containing protein [Candidatus Heimdallarchaeota archaeon]
MSEGIMIGDMLWSPVPENECKNLKLNFFPINTDFKFKAKINLLEKKEERILKRLDGEPTDPFLVIGNVEFKYKEEIIKLSFIYDKQMDKYYLAFRDSTSGKDTYPNGRLIEVENIEQETTMLDFNKAFNFACAYNETLFCPVTPQENWLSFAIEAREKKYH